MIITRFGGFCFAFHHRILMLLQFSFSTYSGIENTVVRDDVDGTPKQANRLHQTIQKRGCNFILSDMGEGEIQGKNENSNAQYNPRSREHGHSFLSQYNMFLPKERRAPHHIAVNRLHNQPGLFALSHDANPLRILME